MPPLPEDEKKKKINTSPYLMTGTSPENKGFGISPVMQDAFSRRPDRSFADTAGAETYDTAAIAKQQQPREVSTTGQAIAAQMAGAPYRIGTQDAEPAASPAAAAQKPPTAPAPTPAANATPATTGSARNYGSLAESAMRGLFQQDGTISFDPKTKTYSGTNVGADSQITGGRNSGAGVSVVPGYFSGGEDSAAARDARYVQSLRGIQALKTAEMDAGQPSPGVTVMDTRASAARPDNSASDVMGLLNRGKIGIRGANMLLDHQTAGDNRAANVLTADREMANRAAIAGQQNATWLQELAANERDAQTRRGLDSRRLALDIQKAAQDTQTFGIGLEAAKQTQALRNAMLDPKATPEQRAAAAAQLSTLSGKGLPQSEWVAGSYKDEMGAETPYLLDKTTGNVKSVPKNVGLPSITSEEEIDKLPTGTTFIAPDGSVRTKKA